MRSKWWQLGVLGTISALCYTINWYTRSTVYRANTTQNYTAACGLPNRDDCIIRYVRGTVLIGPKMCLHVSHAPTRHNTSLCLWYLFENRVLRRIFGPKRGEVRGEWRKLRNEELNDLYSSPNSVRVMKSRRMRWAGHVALTGERTGVYRVLVGKPEGKRTLGRLRRRREDNIKMDLQEVGCGVWTGSSWLRIGTGGGHLWMR